MGFGLPDSPVIDFLLLADRAEVHDGKLYVMGGAWDRTFVSNFEQPVEFYVSLGLLVPWTGTNKQHHVALALENEDAVQVGESFDVGVNVGRPPAVADEGQSFRVLVSVRCSFLLPRPGPYVLVARITPDEVKRTVFYAQPMAQAQPS
jgi:hypothetical protein